MLLSCQAIASIQVLLCVLDILYYGQQLCPHPNSWKGKQHEFNIYPSDQDFRSQRLTSNLVSIQRTSSNQGRCWSPRIKMTGFLLASIIHMPKIAWAIHELSPMFIIALSLSMKAPMYTSSWYSSKTTYVYHITIVKASGTSLYLKIKLENRVIVKQVFQVEDLLLTMLQC